jgi:hypothetical protein
MQSLVMKSKVNGSYLFYSENNGNTLFTIVDKLGNTIRTDELPLSIEQFVRAMEKANWVRVEEGLAS